MHQQVHSYRQPKYCGCPNTPYGIGDAGDTQTSPKEPEDPVVGHCPHGWPIIYNGFLHDQWVLVVMLCPIIVFRMISRCQLLYCAEMRDLTISITYKLRSFGVVQWGVINESVELAKCNLARLQHKVSLSVMCHTIWSFVCTLRLQRQRQ